MNMGDLDGIAWRTSSYSSNGGSCVEVGWRTSSYSSTNGDCVEVGLRADEVLVRDTKDRPGGTLTVVRVPWQALLDQVR
jgi:hypothetical protein